MPASQTRSETSTSTGRIDRIELENFKSYAGHQIIGPFMDFTAVIGPNGAGKSNLMDAISFVVGLQSKDLRGKQLKDLVYKRSGDDGSEERSASVSLVCKLNDVETKFTRSVSEAGVGTYRVNGRVVKWETYSQQLSQVGVLTKAHTGFLVFQGYVSELAAKSPKELADLFEHISGSGELKEEYEQLEKEKKAAEEEQIYNHQKKKGLAQERNNMKKQKEEAEHYKQLEERRRELQKQQYLFRLYTVEREVTDLRGKLTDAQAELQKVSSQHTGVEEQVKVVEKEKSRMSRKCVELERTLAELQQSIEGQDPAAIKLREQIKHLERHKSMQEKSLEKVTQTHKTSEKQEALLVKDLKQVSDALEEMRAEQEAAEGRSGELSMGKREREEYNKLKSKAGSSTAALNEKLATKTREFKSEEHVLLQLQTRIDQLAAERVEAQGKLTAFEERKQTGSERVQELSEQVAQLKEQATAAKSSGVDTRKRHSELREQLAYKQAALSSCKAEQRESERERKSTEALENLMRLFSGVHGRMLDVCKPTQKRFNAAVTIAMGKNMDAIVVETEAVAMDCIRYLKEKKCTPETFVPLDSIRAIPVGERMRKLGGTKKPVIDIISVPEQFERAVQYAVGETIVCDSLEEARKLAYHSGGERYKVVTLDGTLINKAGLMTGGSSQGDRARASKWNQKEYEGLKSEVESLMHELTSLGSVHAAEESAQQVRHKLDSAEQELSNSRVDLQLTTSKESKYRKELQSLSKAAKEADEQMHTLNKKRAAQEAAICELQAQRDAEEDRIFSAFSKKLGVSSVREYEEKTLREVKEKEAQVLELQSQEAKLKSKLQFEQRKDLPGAIQKLQASIATEEEKLAAKKAQQAKAETAIEALRGKATTAAEAVRVAKEEQAAKVAEEKQLKKELRGVSEEMSKAKSKATQIDTELEQLRSKRQSAFQRARLEEVELPLLPPESEPDQSAAVRPSGSGKRKRSAAMAAQEAAVVQEEQSARSSAAGELLASESFSPSGLVGTATLEGEAGPDAPASRGETSDEIVRIDFSGLEYRGRSDNLQQTEKELGAELSKAVSELDGMAPNMKALEQYEEVQARLHSMEGEWDSSKNNARSITNRFLTLQAERNERFMAAFGHVSKVIDDIYKDLTQVEGVPLGGTAYLSLEDPSEPYLHGIKFTAMPPAKRFRDMEQLSGGERTVAALALLFAIHSFKPSPFFVMDEIDAALDNVNVTRVAEYIRERADDGELQFVVISLKDIFYEKANALVGIYRDRKKECSQTATLELDKVADLDGATEDEVDDGEASGGEMDDEGEDDDGPED
eukprot:CAMPEP_0119313214 /NCGR_PEP_ID=MMETSP1333-20130426/28260_1 /TAXON_ID=418940 /ORGANISM="Scyphosphaera apsteinii, Strain RCC1455" /LENGTH=1316 /DNA_ID=CAMNT_0007317997 /DNA_START=36 /DNA_END=3986 /DNA_ORIENTATION=-